MPTFPPGVPYVLRKLFTLAAPVVVGFLGIRSMGAMVNLAVPTWLAVCAALADVPLLSALAIRLKSVRDRRKAARIGATFPPRWDGKWIGNVDLLKRLMKAYTHGYIGDELKEKLEELGGMINLRILWEANYVTTDANIIKAVLATQFNSFVKGEELGRALHSVLGTGVFNSDGEMWKFHRTMARPFFSRERISHFELFDRHAEEAIAKAKERLRAGYAIDFQDLVSRFTLDSATEFLFGSCLHTLSSSLPYPSTNMFPELKQNSASLTPSEVVAEKIANAFAAAQVAIGSRVRLGPIWPIFEIFKSKTTEHMSIVDAFLQPILQNALEKAARDKETGKWNEKGKDEIDEDDTMLDHLVRYTTDPVVLHDETLNILIAGRDTTAASLTFAVYFLSQHPEMLKRLREEILVKVGSTRRPTLEDIRDMKYLRAVINETLRLYPAVPFNVRYAVEDTVLTGSGPEAKAFFVPANVPVSYSVFLMHRRKDYWGPDAEEFDPDRFLDERVSKYLTPNPFIFLPFNAGPRICLGQQFAYNEMSFFLIRLLQNFKSVSLDTASQPPDTLPPAEWANAPGRKGIEKFHPKVHITAYSHGGLWVKMGEDESSDA